MITFADIESMVKTGGVSAAGAVEFCKLKPLMSERNKQRLLSKIEDPKSVIALLFPYYADSKPGNISLYARGVDYHIVLKDRLAQICAALTRRFFGNLFLPFADTSPINEVAAAVLSGAALRGQNGLAICPKHGSYVFVGVIVTDLEIKCAGEERQCQGCGKCIAACPTGALKHGGPERCLSHITQKKAALSEFEKAAITANKMVWGCDACQRVCPHNSHPEPTQIDEFKQNLIYNLSAKVIAAGGLQFRAFMWRGEGVLLRNLEELGER